MPHASVRKGKVGKNLPPLDPTAMNRWPLPERIRFAVAKCDETPDVLAQLGVSARTLSRYKSGDTAPDESFLDALAMVSGTRADWLKAGGLISGSPASSEQVVVRVPVSSIVALVQAASIDLSDDARAQIIEALKRD
jgi:transcriptional regulator with XRE-family HTH domain